MIHIGQITDYLEELAPLALQESYDNSGLIVGNKDVALTGVLCTLDCTEEVIEEAVRTGCNLVVAHHPIVFSGLKKLNGKNYVERTVIAAIKKDIAIYAIHTNLDNILDNGVNSKIAEKLDLRQTAILAPRQDNALTGAGLIGQMAAPIPADRILAYLKDALSLPMIRYTALPNRDIEKVAICGGAGSFLLPIAKERGADLLVTADFKYHEFFDAENQIVIADIGHYESEKFTTELLQDLIQKKFSSFAVRFSEVRTNPVCYYY